MESLYIAMVSAECAPVAKAGGLGDFIHGLGRELMACGHEVEIVLPKYDVLRYECIQGLRPVRRDLWVPFERETIHCDVESGQVDGLRCLFVDVHSRHGFFNRGRIYGDVDDAERFTVFCHVVLEYFRHAKRRPDVIHCNDWQTGLLPVLLYERYERLGLRRTRVCYSLHNLGYQGWCEPRLLSAHGLDVQRLMTPDRLQDPGNPRCANLMKGGIVYSNFVTTVSPRYAWEIQHTEQGMGLQSLLKQYHGKFAGVLNGIDVTTWNPATDAAIPCHYDIDRLPRKAKNQRALRERLDLIETARPLVAIVSRLERQKGIELMLHAISYTLNQGQFVLLGTASEPAIAAEFIRLGRDADPAHCRLQLGYDEDLAHLIYAGADLILIPSRYEPCGLTQMIAMRYGCVPVVRGVGGLADTVFDANDSDRPFSERNGFVFHEPTPEALEGALERALGLWREHPDHFLQLRLNGMRADYSWRTSTQRYLEIYRYLLRDIPT